MWYVIDSEVNTWKKSFLVDRSHQVVVDGVSCYLWSTSRLSLTTVPVPFCISDIADGRKMNEQWM